MTAFTGVQALGVPAHETEVGYMTVHAPAATIVVAGEYASQGEPDLFVTVYLAVDEDGNDVRSEVARRIAKALTA